MRINYPTQILQIAFWILLTTILVFLAFNRHSKTGIFNYRSQIYADKAGYYVYLPASLIYQFNANKFPVSVDEKTGNGFQLDLETNKISTKYFYGVAFMQLPFFLVAHIFARPFGFEADGFSLIYHWSIDLAAIFYLLFSFLLLFKLLKKKFSTQTATITIFFLFAGTNLFYYSILETGMSHVYSFFLFTAWIYLLTFWRKWKNNPFLFGLLFGLVAGFILFVRPLNLLFLIMTIFLNEDYWNRIKSVINWQFLIPALLLIILTALPQFAYWKYLSGSYFTIPYHGEQFSNWLNPKVIDFLFAPNNGLILYNPVFLIMIVGLIYMIRQRIENGWLILTIIALLIYFSSSWWSWSFGCGFGARNFVEYFAILAYPLAFLIHQYKKNKMVFLIYPLLFLFSIYNLKMIYSYGGCWFGDGNWDWSQYVHWILKWPA